MRFLVLFACVIFVYGQELDSSEYGVADTSISPNCSCGWTNKVAKQTESTVNGRAAGPFKYPMMASIIDMKNSAVVCGGTIITNRHIMTSANCTSTLEVKKNFILIGTNNYEPTTKFFYQIDRVVQHPDYVSSQNPLFISIVVSRDDFEIEPTAGPACMPTKPVDLTTETLVSLGWRNLWFKGKDNAYVMETYAKYRLVEECTLDYKKNPDNDKQICTYSRNTFTCQDGGAGGPLLWLNPATNRYTVVGVQIQAVQCQRLSTVVSVTYFLPWIQEVILATGPSSLTCSAPE